MLLLLKRKLHSTHSPFPSPGLQLGGLNETLGPNFEGTILAPTNNAFTTFREALDDVEKPTTPQLIGNVLVGLGFHETFTLPFTL